jgi:hypothetical protein
MANTHRLLLETSVPPGAEVLAAGPRDFCEAQKQSWFVSHELTEYQRILVLRDVTVEREYPFEDGDVTVIGPEAFVAQDGTVFCWKGRNYVPQDSVLSEAHILEAVGYLSSVLADRAGAWDGEHPAWFPEPPEWIELWEDAVSKTGPNAKADEAEEPDKEEGENDVREP